MLLSARLSFCALHSVPLNHAVIFFFFAKKLEIRQMSRKKNVPLRGEEARNYPPYTIVEDVVSSTGAVLVGASWSARAVRNIRHRISSLRRERTLRLSLRVRCLTAPLCVMTSSPGCVAGIWRLPTWQLYAMGWSRR